MKQSFNSTLESLYMGIKVTVIPIPFSVEKTFGTKGKIDVKGTLDGWPIQRTLLSAGDGTHYFIIDAATRKKLGKRDGDAVFVEIEPDETYKIVELPDYFLYELEENLIAKAEYERSPPSMKRWILTYLTEAKSADTKANRVLKVLDIMVERSQRRKK